MTSYPAPPFDADLIPALMRSEWPSTVTVEMMVNSREYMDTTAIQDLIADRGLILERVTIPGLPGDPDIAASVVRRFDHVAGGPGIYAVHGGGMITGDDVIAYAGIVDWIAEFDAVAVSVDYRLAPEHPDPAPADDCYAGLLWAAAHADELGFDPSRLLVTGTSAGGGLAAGVVLRARDSGGPRLAGQLLCCPMLDDRDATVSSAQIDGIGIWDRASNQGGWFALLGSRRGTDHVSAYAAPARETDLAGLPPTFIDVGSAEVFRDECVEFASRIWAAGGSAECHVWSGGFHGYDAMVPDAAVSRATIDARMSFVRRIFQTH